tara:strand:+ start:1377 stop:1589 length:213 start_codon:yes stop_codon:yes gene_type:complete
MGRRVKLQKICLKKYFRHKDEEKKITENKACLSDITFDSFGKLQTMRFSLHPKVERIISDEVERINEEPH